MPEQHLRVRYACNCKDGPAAGACKHVAALCYVLIHRCEAHHLHYLQALGIDLPSVLNVECEERSLKRALVYNVATMSHRLRSVRGARATRPSDGYWRRRSRRQGRLRRALLLATLSIWSSQTGRVVPGWGVELKRVLFGCLMRIEAPAVSCTLAQLCVDSGVRTSWFSCSRDYERAGTNV